MRCTESGPIYLKVLDFGLAKRTEGDTKPTGSGEMVGTPAYMAPEQIDSFGRTLDGRVDQGGRFTRGASVPTVLAGNALLAADLDGDGSATC